MSRVIAITGLGGVVGKNLISRMPQQANYQLVSLYHHSPPSQQQQTSDIRQERLELLDLESIETVLDKVRPDCIIHLAAVTHIDNCETDRQNGTAGTVWQVNVGATKKIVSYCQKNDAHLIYLSTESVFGGDPKTAYQEHEHYNPINWYGVTKAEAEKEVLKLKSQASIIRAVIAYEPDLQNNTFFAKLISALEKQEPFTVVHDQKFTPSYIGDIHHVIWKLVDSKTAGIFHVCSKRMFTPYTFATEVGTKLGYDLSCLKPKSLEEYFGPTKAALRLQHACLNSNLTREKLGFSTTELDQVLSGMV